LHFLLQKKEKSRRRFVCGRRRWRLFVKRNESVCRFGRHCRFKRQRDNCSSQVIYLINFAFCAIPDINVLLLLLLFLSLYLLVGEGEAPKALKLATLHELVLAAEIRRVANVMERGMIAAVGAVVRAEGTERDEAETPARLLKRQTPGMGGTTTSLAFTEKGEVPPTICLRKKEVETLCQKKLIRL
jgi:hypothetical protein